MVLQSVVSIVSSSNEVFCVNAVNATLQRTNDGRVYLKIVLDQVENEIPVRSLHVLQDRYEVEEHVRDLALDVFVDVLVRCDPCLARLHKVDGTGLWQKYYVRLGVRSSGSEATQQKEAVRVCLTCWDAQDPCSQFITVSVKTGGL